MRVAIIGSGPAGFYAADRRLGIPGEGMTRCMPASVFIGWYNGRTGYRHAKVDLSVSRVAVVDNGNVAIDTARVLLRTPAELEKTDTAAHALCIADKRRDSIFNFWLFG